MFESAISPQGAPQSPRSLAVSIAVHSLAVAGLLLIRFTGEAALHTLRDHVTLLSPVADAPKPKPRQVPTPPRALRALPRIKAEPIRTPVIAELPAALPEPRKPVLPEIAAPVVLLPPAPVVKAAGFTEPAPAPVPQPAPKLALRTGGFETADAATHMASPAKGTATGAFDQPASAAPSTRREPVAAASGFMDSSTAPARAAAHLPVRTASFGEASVDHSAAPKRAAAAAESSPVEIVAKPKPTYTEDARQHRIEGEVLIEMEFTASGEPRILRVVRGLGHGLDESALAAARGIRFRPAMRAGSPVDSSAIVHIVFQLAN